MLQIKIEWEDEPRVQDPLLRATWARIEVHVRHEERDLCLTDCLGRRSRSLRQGVYGSAFPLAQWVVQHWWPLLWEPLHTDSSFMGGRARSSDTTLVRWIQRHNLLAAREGFALPDLTLYRDASFTVLRCIPDPSDVDSPYPVRFVTDAEIRLPLTAVHDGLKELIAVIADRIRDQIRDSAEAQEFLNDWEAVQDSARMSSACAWRPQRWGSIPTTPAS